MVSFKFLTQIFVLLWLAAIPKYLRSSLWRVVRVLFNGDNTALFQTVLEFASVCVCNVVEPILFGQFSRSTRCPQPPCKYLCLIRRVIFRGNALQCCYCKDAFVDPQRLTFEM